MALKRTLQELDRFARKQGFQDYPAMLYEFYTVRGLSLIDIGERCHVHWKRTKKHLIRFKIPLRSRGGANNVKVVMTPELLHEIKVNGVPATADRLGVTEHAIRRQLKLLDEK